MLLALSVISAQGAAMGPTAYKLFDAAGGSIGRLDSNDWTLPDPEKVVSSRHALLKCAGGAFYLEDTSTNGTFLNTHERPIPRTEPVKLRDGDRIFIGDYEILVQIIEDAAPAVVSNPTEFPGLTPPSTVEPDPAPLMLNTLDPLAVLGGDSSQPRTGSPDPMPLAAPPSPQAGPIAGDWQATRFRTQPPALDAHPAQVSPPRVSPTPVSPTPAAPPPVPAVTRDSMTSGAQPVPPESGGELLRLLGLDPARVDPAIYQQLADIVRIMVQGMIEVLRSRAEVKNNFRMPITSIRPVENNPLKFSFNAEDALHNLFVKRNPGYLGPTESFQEGFQDIAFHEMAMLAGIRAAFAAMLSKFNPDHLEEIYERKLRRTAMINLGNRLKFWEMYRAQFEEIENDQEASFQLLFGEEFAKAYHEQFNKLATAARTGKP